MTTTPPARDFTVNPSLTPKRPRTAVENHDYAAFVQRVMRADSRRVAAGDVDAITGMIRTAADLDRVIHEAVLGLHRSGYSWSEIGMRLSVSRQAAQQRNRLQVYLAGAGQIDHSDAQSQHAHRYCEHHGPKERDEKRQQSG